jgi:hypothetical protein
MRSVVSSRSDDSDQVDGVRRHHQRFVDLWGDGDLSVGLEPG